MIEVHGACSGGFEGVRDAIAATLASGADAGASAAVMVDGALVADVWGGSVDGEGTQPWERDTITNVWSTTKTMSALCALLLVDRGELDLDAPVARYWPEFADAGKDGVLVRHILSHTSGLSGWQDDMAPSDLYDWEKATARLAAQEPWWPPGTASGYHATTMGFLVGEVVRRVTGQTIGRFFAHEFAGPLDADFHIGLAAEHDHRVAPVIPPPTPSLGGDLTGIPARSLGNPPADASQSWETGWRRAELPASGGHGNARSVAVVQSVLACGGEGGGRRLLSEATCRAAIEEQIAGPDLVLGVPMRFGLGYGLGFPVRPAGDAAVCFWGGWGGSLVVVDLDARMSVAYVMNRMGEGTVGDARGRAVVTAAYQGLRERARRARDQPAKPVSFPGRGLPP